MIATSHGVVWRDNLANRGAVSEMGGQRVSQGESYRYFYDTACRSNTRMVADAIAQNYQ